MLEHLTKEQIPLVRGTRFCVPIHPRLLEEELDPELANKAFPKAAIDWYDDMNRAYQSETDPKTKQWYKEVFLKVPKITEEYDRQVLNNEWEDLVFPADNGFAHTLSISRNASGSLYRSERPELIMSPLVGFTPGQFAEYNAELEPGENYAYSWVYAHHNIDHFPGALFLRNWAILYLNAAIDSLDK